MPWPERQRRAIFLSVRRKKGLAAAKRLMHKHGHGGKGGEVRALIRELRK